jgi:hypothetical protein
MLKKQHFQLTILATFSMMILLSGQFTLGSSNTFHSLPSNQTCASPPKNFNPLLASPDQLTAFGLPRKPTNPSDYVDWVHVVSLAKHHVCPSIKPLAAISHPVTSQTPSILSTQPITSSSTSDSNNWSGYYHYRTTSDGVRIQGVRGWFTETTCEPQARHVIWVGLGGVYSPTLWQVGWDSYNQSWWYEIIYYNSNGKLVDTSEQQISLQGTEALCNFDEGYLYVDYNFSEPNGLYGFIQDASSGYYTSLYFSNIYVDHESGEWVDERSSCGQGKYFAPSTFGPYGEINWHSDFWYTNSTAYHPINYDTYYDQVYMYDKNGYELAYPTGLSGGEYFSDVRTSHAATDVQCFA